LVANIVPESAEVKLEATAESDGRISINTAGAGADKSSPISIKGAGAVEVAAENGVITITGGEPTLSSDANSTAIKLTKTDGESSDAVNFVAGNGLSVTGTDSNKITYSHNAYSTTSSGVESGYISGLTVDNGHITGYTIASLPVDNDTTNVSFGLNADITALNLTDSEGTTKTADLTALIAKVNQYTDDQIATVSSALEYKGVATTTTTVDNPETGWVYLAAENGTVLGVNNVKVGDLLIRYNNQWDLVPSGDELITDTTYEGVVTTGENVATYSIKGSDGVTAGSTLSLSGDTWINLTTDANNVTTISHVAPANFTPEKADDTSTSLTGIIGLTLDKGHVTGIQT
jgi:hypothetical protein